MVTLIVWISCFLDSPRVTCLPQRQHYFVANIAKSERAIY